jgi:ParB family chromosome partitioning protein
MDNESLNYEVMKIPLGLIFADQEFNCRGDISPLDVKGLADEIQQHGLQFPIRVQPFKGKPGKEYRIVAGHRRFMACQLLGWETVPAMISTGLSDIDAKILNLTENLQRQALNIWQEAQAIAHLGLDHSDEWIAKKLGVSKGWVQPRKMLLGLPQEIQDEAKAGLLNQTIIRDCYSLRNDKEAMFELVKHHKDAKARGEKVTIRTSRKDPKVKRKRQPWEIMQLLDLVQKTFGYGLTTRALAWSSGEIADFEILDTMEETAKKLNIPFVRPEVVVVMVETLTNKVREKNKEEEEA